MFSLPLKNNEISNLGLILMGTMGVTQSIFNTINPPFRYVNDPYSIPFINPLGMLFSFAFLGELLEKISDRTQNKEVER